MASDANPIQSSVTHLVQGSQVPTAAKVPASGGNSLPAGGNLVSPVAQAIPESNSSSSDSGTSTGGAVAATAKSGVQPIPAKPQAPVLVKPAQPAKAEILVAQLNKYLNTTGRPNIFRVDPQSGSTIQEVNPANGAVIAQFAASEFPALARSVGATGLLVDSLA